MSPEVVMAMVSLVKNAPQPPRRATRPDEKVVAALDVLARLGELAADASPALFEALRSKHVCYTWSLLRCLSATAPFSSYRPAKLWLKTGSGDGPMELLGSEIPGVVSSDQAGKIWRELPA